VGPDEDVLVHQVVTAVAPGDGDRVFQHRSPHQTCSMHHSASFAVHNAKV